jgi:hypothetical protein
MPRFIHENSRTAVRGVVTCSLFKNGSHKERRHDRLDEMPGRFPLLERTRLVRTGPELKKGHAPNRHLQNGHAITRIHRSIDAALFVSIGGSTKAYSQVLGICICRNDVR